MIVEGLLAKPTQYVELDRFDSIELVIQPGQEWYPAGDLIFYKVKRRSIPSDRCFRRADTFKAAYMKRNGLLA